MKEINAVDFEKEVLTGGKVVVDFYSTECPPCEALAPKFDAMAELYGQKIKFLKIYRQGNRELATELGVSSSPTLLFFENGKQVIDSISGGIKKSEIIERLDTMLTTEEVAAIKANQKPIVSEYDASIMDVLKSIKSDIDQKVYDRNDILKKDAYFEQTVMTQIKLGIDRLGIASARDDRKFIQSRITKQYLDQYNQTYSVA